MPNFQFKSDYFDYSRRNAIPDLLKQILPQADLHGIVGSNRGMKIKIEILLLLIIH
jgi:hypothetical protein